MMDTGLRFSHTDFMAVVNDDIPLLISEVSIWIFENAISREKELGD